VRWAVWRRLRPLRLPTKSDLLADFLARAEGKLLLGALGGNIEALIAKLHLPDPFEAYDGRHPTARRPTRFERLRESVAGGAPVPVWAQAQAVIAYATWKVIGLPALPPGFMPEMAEFLAPLHAAALNVVSPGVAMDFATRLRAAHCADAGRRTVLRNLTQIGTEAMELGLTFHGVQQHRRWDFGRCLTMRMSNRHQHHLCPHRSPAAPVIP